MDDKQKTIFESVFIMRRKQYQIDMCSGPLWNKILRFALPLMASSLLQLLFNAADIIVVGRFAGDNSLAAVGSTSSLVNLLVNLFMGLSIGANVLVARFYGAKREKDLSETIHTSIAISIISGFMLTVIGFFCFISFLSLFCNDYRVVGGRCFI